MRKVLVIDTSILCVWLPVPGLETCGPDRDRWDRQRVQDVIEAERAAKTFFVLPLAAIIETGNHIAQVARNRYECAQRMAKLLEDAVDGKTPWAIFTDQSNLWDAEGLRTLARDWPELAAKKLSMGDMTIKIVADHYAKSGFQVEILTGDENLKAHEPPTPRRVPRRRQR